MRLLRALEMGIAQEMRGVLVLALLLQVEGFGYGGAVDGAVFPLSLPRQQVSGMLPEGLELNSTAATHPVLLTFCVQLHVGAPFTHFNYDEFIITVPFVQWDNVRAAGKKYRGPFSYLPHLYLNETAPVQLGRLWVGDDKELGTIVHEEDEHGSGSFRVTGAKGHAYEGTSIAEAAWVAAGDEANATAWGGFQTNFAAGYNLPSLGQYPKGSGKWKCLPQNYHTADIATLRPIAGSVNVHQPFLGAGALPVGNFSFSPMTRDVSSRGAFRISTSWQYTSLKSDCDAFDPEAVHTA